MTEKIPNCKCFLIRFLPQSSHCFMKNKTENQDLWYFSSSASYSKNFTTVLKCADSNFFSAFQLILKHSTDTRTITLPAKNSSSCNPTQPKPRGHPRRWTTFQDEYLWVVKNRINCGKSQSFPLSCRPCERRWGRLLQWGCTSKRQWGRMHWVQSSKL